MQNNFVFEQLYFSFSDLFFSTFIKTLCIDSPINIFQLFYYYYSCDLKDHKRARYQPSFNTAKSDMVEVCALMAL